MKYKENKEKHDIRPMMQQESNRDSLFICCSTFAVTESTSIEIWES